MLAMDTKKRVTLYASELCLPRLTSEIEPHRRYRRSQ
jgi:hypothetical protein